MHRSHHETAPERNRLPFVQSVWTDREPCSNPLSCWPSNNLVRRRSTNRASNWEHADLHIRQNDGAGAGGGDWGTVNWGNGAGARISGEAGLDSGAVRAEPIWGGRDTIVPDGGSGALPCRRRD